jgi:hypothetical protein
MTCMAFCPECNLHTEHTGDARGDIGKCTDPWHGLVTHDDPEPVQPVQPDQQELFAEERTPK